MRSKFNYVLPFPKLGVASSILAVVTKSIVFDLITAFYHNLIVLLLFTMRFRGVLGVLFTPLTSTYSKKNQKNHIKITEIFQQITGGFMSG